MVLVKFIFWVSICFIFYTYLGYPIIVYLLSLLKKKKVTKGYQSPKISVIIAALNEEKYIGRKIINILKQNYPSDRMDIIIVSDGSRDNTEDIVRSFAKRNGNIKLFSFEERKGKAAAINLGLSKANSEVIIFSDARQTFDPNAIRELAGNFEDPSVGGVSGELVLIPEDSNMSDSLRRYWSFEKWIRKNESSVGSVVGATGAIYGIRRGLFEEIPKNTILDDLLIPMRVISKGYRIVFDEKAIAYDDANLDAGSELRRKVRTLTGNFQILTLMPGILSIRKNRVFFNYFSHKITRLIAPLCLAILLVTNAAITSGFYGYFFFLQILLYTAAVLGIFIRIPLKHSKLLYAPCAFLMLNYAVVLGFIHFIKGTHDVWVKN